jgi:hypothetical protein
MAMKKMTGAKKPVAKMANKAKPTASAGKSNPKAAAKSKGSLPKSATMKSRGSNTSKQVGDQNMREAYNSNRDVKYRKGLPTSGGTGAKSTAADATKSYSPKVQRVFKGIAAESRASMRKGGKGR